MPASVATLSSVGLTWPDGTVALRDLDLLVPPGRSGLVGVNGSGKSTVLRLIAGELIPTTGHVGVTGRVGYLPQDVTLDVDATVDTFLGIDAVRRAIAAVEAGATDPDLYDTIGDEWDVEERIAADLGRIGLPTGVLERRLAELSGGEVVRLALARLLRLRPDVLLLDEPTNNLDGRAREHLYDLVDSWRGALLVVSHDRDLLERMDRIGDLRDGSVRWYGGGFTLYAEQVAAEQAAAEQAVTSARAGVRRQRTDRVEAERMIAQRRRQGVRAAERTNMGKGAQHFWKNRSEKHAGKYREIHDQRLESARERLTDAEARLRDDREIRIDLPGTEVPRGRVVLTTRDLVLRTGLPVELQVSGPDRIGVVGPNGTGKSTLLHTVAGLVRPLSGSLTVCVPSGLLPQRLDVLDDDLSVVQNVAARAPGVEPQQVRDRLARFLFRGAAADRPVRTLSGGERFRATLAALLLADPAPQLLLLDEPTNSLDLTSYDALVAALDAYRGALVVAGHDHRFLAEIGVDRLLDLGSPPAGLR